MLKKILLLALALFLNFTPVVTATEQAEAFTTGKDWREKMSEREKLMALMIPMNFLQRFGVPLEDQIPEYIPKIDKVLESNPYLEIEDVSNIFVSTIYAYEPEARKPLERLEFELNSHGVDERFGFRRVPVILEPEK